jgi:hypothetical protein
MTKAHGVRSALDEYRDALAGWRDVMLTQIIAVHEAGTVPDNQAFEAVDVARNTAVAALRAYEERAARFFTERRYV